jgi:hypothetical protein
MYVFYPIHCEGPMLIEVVSVAIWNRHRFVVAIAIGTWGLSIPFFIQGKSSLLQQATESLFKRSFASGIWRVNNHFQLFLNLPGLSTYRSALHRYPKLESA